MYTNMYTHAHTHTRTHTHACAHTQLLISYTIFSIYYDSQTVMVFTAPFVWTSLQLNMTTMTLLTSLWYGECIINHRTSDTSHTPFQHVDHKSCHIQETSHKCIGQLYVKMANIVTGKKEQIDYIICVCIS